MSGVTASPLPKDEAIRYDAFISYSHLKDKPVAAGLQSAIQKLGKAWHQRRALRIFRDDTSIAATPELWPTIQKALAQSRYLIVLASPQFAASKWCGMEVSYWLEHRSIGTLLLALTEGELIWDDGGRDFRWGETTPLPQCLKGRFVHEPKWIDLRPFRKDPDGRNAKLIDASAEFAATIHGMPKEDLLSQEVRQQKRTLRLAWLAAGILLMLTGAASWQWAEAVAQRREAEIQRADAVAQRDRAERNLEIARKTAKDLIDKIALGLRFTEGMRVEAIQEILETVRSTMGELVRSAPDDPRLQQMMATMLDRFANTYREAGALDRALAATEEALSIIRKLAAELGTPDVQNQLSVTLNTTGDIRKDRGNRTGALAAFEESLAIMRALVANDPTNPHLQRGANIALTKIGDMRLAERQLTEAIAAYEEALIFMRKFAGARPNDPDYLDRQRDLAVSLNKVGETKLALRDEAGALPLFEEGLAIRRRLISAGPWKSDWQRDLSQSLMYVGNIYLRQGKKPQALAAYEECLPIRRKLVSMNPGSAQSQRDLGIILGILGEIWLDEGSQSAAAALLEESVAILRELARAAASNASLQTDLATGLFSLARAVAADIPRVRTLLQEAITIVEKLEREGRSDPEIREFLRVLRESVSRLPARRSR
jgi:tetratricopeptide (TPR) repeat protein